MSERVKFVKSDEWECWRVRGEEALEWVKSYYFGVKLCMRVGVGWSQCVSGKGENHRRSSVERVREYSAIL